MIDIPTGKYTILRASGAGKWGDDGRFHKSETSEFTIEASIQPISNSGRGGAEIIVLPEHRKNSEMITIFSEEELFVTDPSKQTAADIVVYRERKFEVMKVQDWSDQTDINHFQSFAVLQDDQGTGRVND